MFAAWFVKGFLSLLRVVMGWVLKAVRFMSHRAYDLSNQVQLEHQQMSMKCSALEVWACWELCKRAQHNLLWFLSDHARWLEIKLFQFFFKRIWRQWLFMSLSKCCCSFIQSLRLETTLKFILSTFHLWPVLPTYPCPKYHMPVSSGKLSLGTKSWQHFKDTFLTAQQLSILHFKKLGRWSCKPAWLSKDLLARLRGKRKDNYKRWKQGWMALEKYMDAI